jgi:hypothetical protein
LDGFIILSPAGLHIILEQQGFSQRVARQCVIGQGKDTSFLFHDEIIPDGCDPFNAVCDFARLIDSVLRINEAAQLNNAFAGFDADLK